MVSTTQNFGVNDQPQIKRPQIIVLDDDPTGSQTVHSCLLLLQWDVATLKLALLDDSPIFFVLTNTRALAPAEAAAITHDVCQNLKQALMETQTQDFLLVSRSDSTLRGHYPVETDVIAAELGPFDAHFMVPAFFEGGRITVDSVHYIVANGVRTPAHETEFAKDSVFGYHTSYLPDYVAEKTAGRISAIAVERFTLDLIRQGTYDRLMALKDNVCVAVDSEVQADLDGFAQDLLAAAAQGKRFLFRSAASLLTALAALPPQPVAAAVMHQYVRQGKPGVIIVGSHVQKTTQQLEQLLKEPNVEGIEVEVTRLRENLAEQSAQLQREILERVAAIQANQRIPVIYTSRQELSFADKATRLAFGEAISALLMAVVQQLPKDTGFLISKGGITSNDTLSKGLALNSARLLGQIIPGVSVITTGPDHPTFPNLPVVLFPGNVGDQDALVQVCDRFGV